MLVEEDSDRYPASVFNRILEILRRGIRWCKNYQAILDLKDGVCAPAVLTALKLADFGASLTAGRSVQAYFSDATIRTNPVLCDVMMENALDNARKHGHPADPDIRCSIVVSTDPERLQPNSLVPDRVSPSAELYAAPTVTFKVSNRVNPADPKLPVAHACPPSPFTPCSRLCPCPSPRPSPRRLHAALAATCARQQTDRGIDTRDEYNTATIILVGGGGWGG